MTRGRGPLITFTGSTEDAHELVRQLERLGGKSKYLCSSCDQLRMSRVLDPKYCGGCRSTNIDVETDLTSQRLEVIRLGGRANYEHVRNSRQLGQILDLVRRCPPERWVEIIQTVPPEEWERLLQEACLGH